MESSHHLYEERGLTVDYLNECLRYENGKLFWRNRPLSHFQSEKSYKTWTKRFAGSECGSPNSKHNKMAYLRFGIKLDGKVRLFLVHRAIWALCTGSFPSKLIDHLDGDKDLRVVNVAGNGIYTYARHSFTQDGVNNMVRMVLDQVHRHWNLDHVVSGGQTGADLAGLIAAAHLDIDCTGMWPKGYKMRFEDGIDVTHTPAQIMEIINQYA